MKRSMWTPAAILVAMAVVVLGTWAVRTQGHESPGKMESIRIAYAPYEPTALFWIAEDRGFLAENGIQAAITKYNSGVEALEGMIKGEADVAVGPAEFPLVRTAFNKEKVRVVGIIDKTELIYVIARKDRGIGNAGDLRGKKVGTALKSVAEFYLGVFLNMNGLNTQDIALVDIRTPEQWVNAIAEGDIDAIAIAQPYADMIKKRLGENAVVWPAQCGQVLHGLVVASDEWIAKHPEVVKGLLRSLVSAEEYLVRHPAEAKAIVGKRLNLDAAYLESAWPQNQFSLSLDQSLVMTMEDQARWMMKNNLTEAKEVPDFLDHLYLEALEEVRPDAVTVLH